jgi:outer membrane receptor protein involved in Fe transport
MVFTPSFLPDFNFSLDYFQTKMTDSITGINYQATNIQDLCIASAPSYNSPFCSLATRPITNPADPAFTTPANYPTETYNSPLNAANQKTRGYDAQLNYRWEMFSGKFNLRHLLSYQPVNETVNLPGTAPTLAVAPVLRQTTYLSYQNGDWTWALQNQWLSSMRLNSSAVTPTNQNYVRSSLPAYDVVDVTASKRLQSWAGAEVFLTISNLTNTRAPLVGDASGIPGLFYPTPGFYDDMGRFFTLGLKVGF